MELRLPRDLLTNEIIYIISIPVGLSKTKNKMNTSLIERK